MESSELEQAKQNCSTDIEEHLYKIGMFAAMNHVTIKALRYYDEQDILKPCYVENETGYRYYRLNQMAEVHQIIALREMGFTIEEIKQIQRGSSEKQLLEKKRRQLLKELATLTEKLARVESYLSEENMELDTHILIKSLPKVTICSMKVTLESYDELFTKMPQMGQEMEKLGCECSLPEYCFTNYLEPRYKEEKISVELCEAVTELKQDTECIQFKELEEVKEAACIFHKGPYRTLPQSYAKILKYIEENGLKISGNIRESYIDGIWNQNSEEDWLTEIQIPVEK